MSPSRRVQRGKKRPRKASRLPIGLCVGGIILLGAVLFISREEIGLGHYNVLDEEPSPLRWILANTVHPKGFPGALVRSWGEDIAAVSDWTGMDQAMPYDQSLCVMALTSRGHQRDAVAILRGLQKIQNEDGSFSFFYNISDPEEVHVSEGYPAQAAWVAMAVNYYTWKTNDPSFLPMAVAAMNYVLSLQDSDGGVIYHPKRHKVKSVEHALDAYSAWRHLAALLRQYGFYKEEAHAYEQAARKIREFLQYHTWMDDEGRFRRGKGDAYRVLDVNTWGILALGSRSAGGKWDFTRGLDYIEKTFRHELKGISGFDFNCDQRSDYSANRERRADGTSDGDGLDTVWSEGTLGAVLAFYEAGMRARGDYYLNEMRKMIYTGEPASAQGGVLYVVDFGSSSEYLADGKNGDPLNGVDDTGVGIPATNAASTAWFILAEDGVNPFDPFPVSERYY